MKLRDKNLIFSLLSFQEKIYISGVCFLPDNNMKKLFLFSSWIIKHHSKETFFFLLCFSRADLDIKVLKGSSFFIFLLKFTLLFWLCIHSCILATVHSKNKKIVIYMKNFREIFSPSSTLLSSWIHTFLLLTPTFPPLPLPRPRRDSPRKMVPSAE
mgnify:CR=1 FL=1